MNLAARPAWAHAGEPLAPHDLWGAWLEDPAALAVIGLASWLYARGCGALWARAGMGRGIPRWRLWSYSTGVLVLLLALVSPLDPLGGALFSAHMVQHELLIMVAAPLLLLGHPLLAFTWALPRPWRKPLGRRIRTPPVRALWRWLTRPAVAWTLYAIALWLWHTPRLYEAALTSEPVHLLQHLSFFATALLFWWPVLHPSPYRRLGAVLAVFYLFATALHGSALGAFLSLSRRAWYPAYEEGVARWGMTLLEDQQLGGLIMWIPFGALYPAIALGLLGHWLRRPNEQAGHVPIVPASKV
ncbi:MAG TPA: cytochrome c oxidase assembly protein [Longimicrobiaceae bacterium]